MQKYKLLANQSESSSLPHAPQELEAAADRDMNGAVWNRAEEGGTGWQWGIGSGKGYV